MGFKVSEIISSASARRSPGDFAERGHIDDAAVVSDDRQIFFTALMLEIKFAIIVFPRKKYFLV